MWQPGELEPRELRVVSLDELCVGKILALLDRAAVRDAWDVGRLPRIAPEVLGSKPFRVRFLALSAILDHPLTAYGRDRLAERETEREVRERLLPMLVAGQEAGVERLVENAWGVVEPLLELEAEEVEFVTAIQRGEFRGDLLRADALSGVDALESHPAVQWKLRSVRRHQGRKAGGET